MRDCCGKKKKKIESNVFVDMGTVPFRESVFYLFLAAIQKCLQKSLEKTSNVADFSQKKPADDVHNVLVICRLLNIWLHRGICFNTLHPLPAGQISVIVD